MSYRLSLKTALKRGAIVAAANWQVIVIQATADSLFKLVVAVPVIGGLFLVALTLRTEPGALMSLAWRDMAATIIAALRSQPLVLSAFVLAVTVAVVGGSLFTFLVKAGSVGVLAQSELHAGSVEEDPWHADVFSTASRFSVELFIESARTLFPRYARLGFLLIGLYIISTGSYVALVMPRPVAGSGWGLPAFVTGGFVAWITLVNLLYLLAQVVIAAEDCHVMSGLRRVLKLLASEWRSVGLVFLVVLVLVVSATGASLVASAALGLIAFVPFLGIAMLPLQLVAWLLRALVFQYIGLTSVGAYLKLYRTFAGRDSRGRARAGGLAAMGQTG